MPTAKLAAAITPMPDESTIRRHAASEACQPVVPITTSTRAAARRASVCGTAPAVEKSMATAAPWVSKAEAAVRLLTTPTTSHP